MMMKLFNLRLVLLAGIFCFFKLGVAQPVYYDKVVAPFTGLANGDTEWVDLDGDNDLDMIAIGATSSYVPSAHVYENVSGNFTLRATTIPGVHYGSLAIGDFDKDGDPDILISGSTSNVTDDRISALFRNDGAFVFTQQYTFQGLSNATVAWIDVDNDEDLDFIMTGLAQNDFGSYITFFFENTGSGFTQLSGTNLPDCLNGAIDVADANGDGRMDIMLTSIYVTGLYINNGDKTFSKDEDSAFLQLHNGGGRWGDFDGDGDMDVLLTGNDSQNQYYSRIYENTHGNTTGSFIERTDIALMGMGVNWHNGIQWFDYNSDGKLDILLTGRTAGSGGQTHRLYTSNGGGSFTETLEPLFETLDDTSLDAGDFDNDGDLDISFLGYHFYLSPGGPISGYYKNIILNGTPASNTKPQPPSSATFTETFYRREIRFKWDAGSDTQTPVAGLTYNFYLRDDIKKLVVPNVDFASGYLRTANPANGFGKRGFVNDVPEGPLYYAVQSIDGSKAGSVFSSEKMFFHFNGPECVKAEIMDEDDVKLSWLDHSTLETNFSVLRSTSPQTGFVQVATLPANTLEHTDNFSFLTETYYYFRINGYDATHTSPYDSLILMIPEPPTALETHFVNASKIQLTWQDNSQYETGFLLKRKKSSGSVFVTIATLPPNTEFYEDTGLEQCTEYDYTIQAISNNGALPPLDFVSGKTNCLPIGINFQLETLEETQLMLSTFDFESNFIDADVTDYLLGVKIRTLPLNGVLFVSGVPATIGQELATNQLDLISFLPEEDFAGLTAFSVNAFDGIDYALTAWTVAINVIPVNDPPEFGLAASHMVNEDFIGESKITPSLIFIPHEVGDNITYSISPQTSDKVNVSINTITGVVTLTSVQNKFGEIEFTVTADDGHAQNNTFSKIVKLIINPVNDPSVVGMFADMEVELGSVIPPVAINITDIDNPITASMFSALSNDQLVQKNEKVTFTVNGSGEAFMNIIPEGEGVTTVTVIVTDGAFVIERPFGLTVLAVTGIESMIEAGLDISPNPFSDELTISLEQSLTGHNQVILRDILGRDVVSRNFNTKEMVINTGNLSQGIYLVDLIMKDGTRVQRRVVKK